MKKELSNGSNKIILYTADLDFQTESCPVLESKASLRTNDRTVDMELEVSRKDSLNSSKMNSNRPRCAKYKGDICVIKYLNIKGFSLKNSVMRELKTVSVKPCNSQRYLILT